MKLSYYAETDSLYVEFRDLPGIESRVVSDGLVIDFAADGSVVGLDIEGASRLDLHTLETVALPVQVTS